jgi:predicted amino acid racemase
VIQLKFNRSAILHNFSIIDGLCRAHGAELMVVTKAACSFLPLVELLAGAGARSVGDSNAACLAPLGGRGLARYLLKTPPSALSGPPVAWDCAFVSHQTLPGDGPVAVMVELGDGKDGVPLEELPSFLDDLAGSGRPVAGVAGCFSCLLGRRPDPESWAVLARAAVQARERCGAAASLVSAGGTVALDDLAGARRAGVTQLRVGEGLLLGWDSARPGPLAECRTDTLALDGEVLDVWDKTLPSPGGGGRDAFGRQPVAAPGGVTRRAVLDLGALAAPAAGLVPLDPGVAVVGQTFDFLVLELRGDARGLAPGDRVSFRPDYAALSQACINPLVGKFLS